jgi:hypothetical protein
MTLGRGLPAGADETLQGKLEPEIEKRSRLVEEKNIQIAP